MIINTKVHFDKLRIYQTFMSKSSLPVHGVGRQQSSFANHSCQHTHYTMSSMSMSSNNQYTEIEEPTIQAHKSKYSMAVLKYNECTTTRSCFTSKHTCTFKDEDLSHFKLYTLCRLWSELLLCFNNVRKHLSLHFTSLDC